MKVSKLSILMLILSTCFLSSQSSNFYVGGDQGWIVHPSVDYSQWAQHNRFRVGDSLVFKYKKGSDCVLLVHEADFYTCNMSNPVHKWDNGESVFKFEHPGPFFFISGEGDHCQQGQKLVVVVMYPRAPNPETPAPWPAPVHHSPSPAPVPYSPTPVPVHHSPSPAPMPYSPTPVPVHHSPSPAPMPYSPTPVPVHHSPSPAPMAHTPSPAPAHHTPTPTPAHDMPSPAPHHNIPTPSPAHDVPSPAPGHDMPTPTPSPVTPTPSSEPPASTPPEPEAPAPAPVSFALSVTPSNVCIFVSTLLVSLAGSSFMGVM